MERAVDRGRRRGVPERARWFWATIIAVVAHGLFALFLSVTGALAILGPIKGPRVSPVALRTVGAQSWAKNRVVRPETATPADRRARPELAKDEKKERETIPPGKVVDVAPGNGQKPDEGAKFLAESNNRVDKESRSKDATPFYKNAMPQPTTTLKPSDGKGHDQTDRAVVAGNDGKGNEDKPAASARTRFVFEIPSVPRRDRLALKLDPRFGGDLRNQWETDEIVGNAKRLRIQSGGADDGDDPEGSLGRLGSRATVTLTPSSAVLDRIAGAPANDLTPLDDLEEGAATFLNTREWKFSSFFNRIKQNVGMHWDPGSVVARRDPTHEAYLYKDRNTVLSVTLDSQGLVKEIAVARSCGVDFLDKEAIAAFQRSQPFPNPPPALQNARGEIQFNFGFYLQVDRAGLRLFRPN